MPMIKNKSKQYLFKNKLNIRRKSKKELLIEKLIMMIFAFFLLFINYLIPQKVELTKSFKNNIIDISSNLIEILFDSFEILIVLLICFILLLSMFLIVGSINRIFKVIFYKSRKIRFR